MAVFTDSIFSAPRWSDAKQVILPVNIWLQGIDVEPTSPPALN